ncbi:MAG: hypothetical protein V3T17_02170 [Pseudomonadales bacterium]
MTINEGKYYAKIGMQAAERAARKVIEQAHKDNEPMPVWDGEKVDYQIPPLPKSASHPLAPSPHTPQASGSALGGS